MEKEIKIIAEKIYEGSLGEGYECGVEYETGKSSHTKSGYFGKTPEQAFVRMLLNEAKGAASLARAVNEEVQILQAITQYLADKFEIDLINLPKYEYTMEERFNASKVDRLEKENSALRKMLDRCFEEVIGALGADCTITPTAEHEKLANDVYQLIK